MARDYDALRLAEMADISEFLHGLAPDQWDHESLCDGWRVRDVVSHMCVGYTTPMAKMVALVARHGFKVPKASFVESKRFGTDHTPAQILDTFDRIHRQNIKKGISKVIKPQEGLVDHTIHHSDIRRPLGFSHAVPEERLVAALDVIPKLAGFVGAKSRAAGLRIVATDADWAYGDGPEIRGAGEALLLALSGRPAGLAELEGEGVGTLKERLAA